MLLNDLLQCRGQKEEQYKMRVKWVEGNQLQEESLEGIKESRWRVGGESLG